MSGRIFGSVNALSATSGQGMKFPEGYIFVTALGTYVKIRREPKTGDVIAMTDGSIRAHKFLGYTIVKGGLLGDDEVWYYIEFEGYPAAVNISYFKDGVEVEDVDTLEPNDKIIYKITEKIAESKGVKRGWISEKGKGKIAASFEVFLNDLRELNKDLDYSPMSKNKYRYYHESTGINRGDAVSLTNKDNTDSNLDTMLTRMVRLRQLSYGKDSNYAFDYDDPLDYSAANINSPKSDYVSPDGPKGGSGLRDFNIVKKLGDGANTGHEINIKFRVMHHYTHFYIDDMDGDVLKKRYILDLQHSLLAFEGNILNRDDDETPRKKIWRNVFFVPLLETLTEDVIWGGDLASPAVDKYKGLLRSSELRIMLKKIESDVSLSQKTLQEFRNIYCSSELFELYTHAQISYSDLQSDFLGAAFYDYFVTNSLMYPPDSKFNFKALEDMLRLPIGVSVKGAVQSGLTYFARRNGFPDEAIYPSIDLKKNNTVYTTRIDPIIKDQTRIWWSVRKSYGMPALDYYINGFDDYESLNQYVKQDAEKVINYFYEFVRNIDTKD